MIIFPFQHDSETYRCRISFEMFQTYYFIDKQISFLKYFKRWKKIYICQNIAPSMTLESYKFKYTKDMRITMFTNMIEEFKGRIHLI